MSVSGLRPVPKPSVHPRPLDVSKPAVKASYSPLPMLAVGLILSVAWIVGCLVLASTAFGGLVGLNSLGVTEWAMVATGACLPLFLAWTILLGQIQSRGMKVSLLNELAARHQPQMTSAAIGLDTTRHMKAISDEMEARIQSFHKMTDDLSSVLVGLTSQMETQNQGLDDLSLRMATRAQEVTQHLATQTTQIDSAETRVSQLVSQVNQAASDISALVSTMKQDVEAPMLNISDNMRDAVMTLGDQLETLRGQLSSVNQTHDHTLASSEVVRKRLAHETESLRLEAEGAFANIDAVSTKLADQITGLNEIGLGAAQQIATVQQDFTQQAQNLSQVSTQLGEHVQTIAGSIDRQNNQLELLGNAAKDYGTAIAEQVKANADILNTETDLATSKLRAEMEEQLSGLNACVDAQGTFMEGTARRLEKRMSETLTRGEALLEALTHANSDSVLALDKGLSESLEAYKVLAQDALGELHEHAATLTSVETTRLEQVKRNVAETLASLHERCEQSVTEMTVRATATGTLLETQTAALSKRLDSVSYVSEDLHNRLSSAADALGDQLVQRLDGHVRAHVEDATTGVHAMNDALGHGLAQWQADLNTALEQAKDSTHTMVATSAGSLKHLSDESIAALLEAGQQVPELAESIIFAASKARGDVVEITSDLHDTLGRVVQTVEETCQATELMQRDLAQAPARLDAATKALSTMNHAISTHAQGVEIHANNMEASSDRVVQQLNRHTMALQDAALVTERVLDDQNGRLEASTKTVLSLTESFASNVLTLTSQAEHDLRAMAELSASTVGAVSATSVNVGTQIQDFTRQANDLRGLLTSIGGLANEHGMALQKVGEQAENRSARLMSLVKDDQRDAFLGSAERLVDRLHGLAVDVDSILDGTVDPGVIAAFQAGDRGVAVRKLISRTNGNQAVSRVAQMYTQDPKFRERVDHYVDGFDDLLSRAAKADTSKLMHTTFLTADIGKLYVFLTQSLGVLAAAE